MNMLEVNKILIEEIPLCAKLHGRETEEVIG